MPVIIALLATRRRTGVSANDIRVYTIDKAARGESADNVRNSCMTDLRGLPAASAGDTNPPTGGYVLRANERYTFDGHPPPAAPGDRDLDRSHLPPTAPSSPPRPAHPDRV